MIKKGKLHHKGSKNTKPGIEGVGLASDLRVLRVFVANISSVNSVSLDGEKDIGGEGEVVK